MSRLLAPLLLLCVLAFAPFSAQAAPDDYETVGGHFFGQTGDKPGAGFGVSDADGQTFWGAFRALGGADTLGFPTSRRFEWRGRATQVFQRGVLQFDPFEKRVVALNVMDMLHEAGRDGWLKSARSIPPHLAPGFDAGKSWEEIVEARQGLLEAEPKLRQAYFAVQDPIATYGLPTSPVTDMGNHRAVRLQRGVLQLWTSDTPWAPAGTVTHALIGDVARDAGLFTTGVGGAKASEFFAPEAAWAPKSSDPEPVAPPIPAVLRPPTVPAGIRWIDVDLGRQRLTLMEGDSPVFEAPVTTGKPGFTTPRGTFRVFSRVFNETMDSLTTGIPRNSAEGYFLKDIFFTQYFADGGFAIHTNYWQPASVFGSYPTSHGCVGMRQADAQVVWNFATFGTPVHIH